MLGAIALSAAVELFRYRFSDISLIAESNYSSLERLISWRRLEADAWR